MSDEEKATLIHIPDFKKLVLQVGGGTLVTIALFSFAISSWIKDWHFNTFQTLDSALLHAQGIHDKAQQNTDENRMSIDALTLEIRLNAALARVDSLNSDLFDVTQQLKERPGDRDLQRRVNQVAVDLSSAEEYANCLLNLRPNCELIRFHQP